MVRQGHSSQLVLLVLGMTLGTGGCVTPADLSLRNDTTEARHALQLAQEREQVLAALRADMASTRIAAAKQEAELQELRASVVQLRQENGESHQALQDATRTLDARETELAAMKTERDQLAQASAQTDMSDQKLGTLQETVASLRQELTELKSAVARAAYQPVGAAERSRDVDRIIPAVQILQEVTDHSNPSWITVQPGDSWWKLARTYKTTIEALRAVNGRVGDHLTLGEQLRLP